MNDIERHGHETPLTLALPGACLPERGEDLVAALTSPLLDPLFQRPLRTGVESAWFGHVPFAHWIVAACRPRLLVELGTHNGASYAAFCEALARFSPDSRAYAVDTWQGDDHAGHYGDEVYWDLRRFHDERFAGFSDLLRCTFEDALPYFADGSVDLLHIDGFHSYEAVRGDFEAWRPKLSDRAVVLFHDTNMRERGFGVWRLWAELQQSHAGFEFLHGHGLGVLAHGADVPEAVRMLCALTVPREIAAVRERFALLGERWVEVNERQGSIAAQQRAEAALAGATLELANARAGHERRDTALAEATRELADARTEQERLNAALHAAGQETEAARAEVHAAQAAAERDKDALRARLEASDAEQDALRAELARLGAERGRLGEISAARDAEREQERAQLAALRRHHHAVVSSASWRATAPARRFGARFPGLARQAQRAATFGVVTASGRLPDRVRLRRQVREDAEALASTPLFDPARYLARYPEVAQAGADPLWHYIWTGAAAGYDPHPLFDSRWYLAQHPELAARHVNPLAHYLREGAALGWDPHPLFDTAFYVAQEPEVAGRNTLLHFVEVGARRGRDPNPFFDMDSYWEEHIRDSGVTDDPLSDYVLRGAAAGLDPHTLFDTDWYARTYPDSAGWNPLAHYLREGRGRGYAPCLLVARSAELPPPLRFVPQPAPDVSIIVPTYGRLFDTLRCLTSIMMHSGGEATYEVIVADDRPDAPIAPHLREIPGLRIEQNPCNLGFLRSCKRAAGIAAGRYLLFLNNDATVHPGWLAPLVRLADSDPRVGIVGCKLLNADGTVQEAGGIIHSNGWGQPYGRGDDPDKPEYNFVREVDVVIGACFLVRAAAWDEVGGFDERFAPAYYEEFDLAFALRERGWQVLYQPASRVTHFDASSYGQAERDRQSVVNHGQFCRKWSRALAAQPKPDAPPYLARERPAPGGHILVVDNSVPEPDKHAGAVATFDWLRLMREAGLRVTYAPHDRARPEPYTTTLQQMGIEVLYGDVDLQAWLAENGGCLDWVWTARPDVTEPLLDAVERFAPGRLIYFTHDLHFLREQRRFELEGDFRSLEESRRVRRVERDIFRRARVVITPSADEARVIQELVPSADARAVPLYSVPAAPLIGRTDPAAFPEALSTRDTVLFVGGYAHPPNLDAALWLAREIMPLIWREAPETRLVLAGSKPAPELLAVAGEQIEVPGWVSDLGPLYARARLSISPLRYGAGVKGKIIASLQAGVPVVTTTVGNEGLALRDGIEALVGDTQEALAAAALALLRDPALCARLAEAGAAVLRCRFGEDAARRVLMQVLGQDYCPACGRRIAADHPVQACEACGAGECDRSLAEAVLRPWRGLRVGSLREAAPLLARSRVTVPAGPLAAALRRTSDNPEVAEDLDLLVRDRAESDDGAAVRPGGRWIFPAPAEATALLVPLLADGWDVRLHEAGMAVIEATKPGSTA